MRHSRKINQVYGKPARKDFSFGRYINKEEKINAILFPSDNKVSMKQLERNKESSRIVAYDSRNKIPAIKYRTGYRPQQK